MGTDWSVDEICGMTPLHLESMFLKNRDLSIPPTGRWRGRVLARMDNEGARRPHWQVADRLLFGVMPWGIDFDRGRWFFLERHLRVGHFEVRAQRSKWRDTDAFCLHYGVSSLPGTIKRYLYDEVKPLSPGWLLGIGGIDADRGEGDHFWFALEKL